MTTYKCRYCGISFTGKELLDQAFMCPKCNEQAVSKRIASKILQEEGK